MATNLEFIKSETSGSSVSSFSVDNIFSDDYQVYKILVKDLGLSGGTVDNIGIRFLDNTGTAITSANYDRASLQLNSASAFAEEKATNLTDIGNTLITNSAGNYGNSAEFTIYNPYQSTYTFLNGITTSRNNANSGYLYARKGIGVLKLTTSCRGIQFTGNGFQLKVSVYGVK